MNQEQETDQKVIVALPSQIEHVEICRVIKKIDSESAAIRFSIWLRFAVLQYHLKIAKSIRLTRGIGATIAAIILMLIFFGILIPFLALMSSGVLTWQQTYYSVGVFQQDYLTFNTTIITWWAVLGILFPLIIWGILQAQRRREQEY